MNETPIANQENIVRLEAQTDERLEMIKQIEQKLPKIPQKSAFFENHPNYSDEVKNLLIETGLAELDMVGGREFDYLFEIKSKVDKSVAVVIDSIYQIYQDYENTVEECENEEKVVYEDLCLNGDRFENITINRLIMKLYEGNGNWRDFDEAFEIKVLDNEWLSFYQIIRNESPLVIAGLQSKIVADIRSAIGGGSLVEKDYDGDTDGENDSEHNTVGVFDDLDTYLDVNNIKPEFASIVADILFQAVESGKVGWGEFDDTSHEIDRRIHAYRDTGTDDAIIDYIYSRLEPRSRTVFQKIKLEASVDAWSNSDRDYTSFEDISMPAYASQEWNKISTELQQAVSSPIQHDQSSLWTKLTKDCYAEYISDDTFYVVNKDSEGEGRLVSIKDLLVNEGVESDGVSNSKISAYRSLMDLRVRVPLEQNLGFSLAELNARQQMAMLDFMEKCKQEDFDSLLAELSTLDIEQRKKLCVIFLATEDGALQLSQLQHFLKHPESDKFIDSAYQLIGQIETTQKYLREQMNVEHEQGDVSAIYTRLIEQVRSTLLKHGNQDEILSEIEVINTETIIFLNSFKTLKERGLELSLEDIGQCEFNILNGLNISDEDMSSMRDIYSVNQSGVGAHDEIMAHFEERVKNPDARFYLFKRQGKIQSFVAFEPSKRVQGALEVTSFNVSPDARGYRIGEAMLEEAIDREAVDNMLEGECYANLPISAKYIETGWIAEGYFTEPGKQEGDIDQLINIRRDDSLCSGYWGKGGINAEQIVSQQGVPDGATIITADKQADLPFAEQFTQDKVLTRIVFDPTAKKYYGVFEERINSQESQARKLSDLSEVGV
ncbi:GNAT family N-acetyltransferase [Candidatus Kaiserbacteria bacterium]|nr:GNAT family N-acetyltransferase [Candidatus Kaiserbacteria bacterium]